MTAHPLIHSELARQREQDLRRSAQRRRRSEPTSTSDELRPLVLAATRGDGQAWESLVERLTPTLRGVVRGYRLNAADTEDVVQAAWTSAFANIDRLREPEAIGSWLIVIARREALRLLDRGRRQVLVEEPRYLDERDYSAPESALIEAEQRQAVHAAVDRLPERQRTLLRALLRDSDVSYVDVSRKLDMPVGSIGPTRERALAVLRRDRRLTALVSPRRSETSS
jgi:RNA polymerase sigma factor (sigma-70 family)